MKKALVVLILLASSVRMNCPDVAAGAALAYSQIAIVKIYTGTHKSGIAHAQAWAYLPGRGWTPLVCRNGVVSPGESELETIEKKYRLVDYVRRVENAPRIYKKAPPE